MVGICFITTAFVLLVASVYASEPVLELPHRGCYFPNWGQWHSPPYTFANVDPSLCTYILVAFLHVTNNALVPRESNDIVVIKEFSGMKAKQKSLKVLVSIGGGTSELTGQVRNMASSAGGVAAFADNAAKTLREWGADGLDVDWEFPTGQEKDQFSKLLEGLRAAFDKEAEDSGKERLILSAALHLPPGVQNEGYDGQVIDKTLDIANIMTYDYITAWDDATHVGHHSPLNVGPQGKTSKLSSAGVMNGWADLGVSKSKLVLGLPMYGRAWLLSDPNNHGLGAPATGAYGAEGGTVPFSKICQLIKEDEATVVFDKSIQASYAYTDTYWIGYDDVQTIKTKTKWAKDNEFGGVMVWELSQDDSTNSCGLGKYPLLSAIRDILAKPSGATTPSPPQTKTMIPPKTVGTSIKPTVATQKPPTAAAGSTKPAPTAATTKPKVTVTAATTPKPAAPSGSCNVQFCRKQAKAGVYAIGTCSSSFCQCDDSSIAYPQKCDKGLVFNDLIHGCDWKDNVCP